MHDADDDNVGLMPSELGTPSAFDDSNLAMSEDGASSVSLSEDTALGDSLHDRDDACVASIRLEQASTQFPHCARSIEASDGCVSGIAMCARRSIATWICRAALARRVSRQPGFPPWLCAGDKVGLYLRRGSSIIDQVISYPDSSILLAS